MSFIADLQGQLYTVTASIEVICDDLRQLVIFIGVSA